MEPDRLFLEKVTDLRRRIDEGTEYDLLEAAALLRHLLVDNRSLVTEVNRRRSEKLLFRVHGGSYFRRLKDLGVDLASMLDEIHGGSTPFPDFHDLTRDQFLKLEVVLFEGQAFSVLDILRYASNVAGGVHLGRPNEDRQPEIARLEGSGWSVSSCIPFNVSQLRGIALVVLDALEPLRNKVEESLS